MSNILKYWKIENNTYIRITANSVGENKRKQVMLEFKPTQIHHIRHLRNAYFYEIEFSQERYLEWMIRDSLCYKIFENSHEVGYFIMNKENILLEFYLITETLIQKESIFNQIISDHPVEKIYCKSFDHVLLTCAHTFGRSSRIIGAIFRDYIKSVNIDYENQLRTRPANKSDIAILLSYENELNKSPEDLKYTISNNMLYMFEKNGFLLGCGYLIKILPDKNYYDIGVWVNPEFREQGCGTMIVSYMKRYCFSHSYKPVCGCDIENIASRKTLEKNGFVSKHCIIEFTL